MEKNITEIKHKPTRLQVTAITEEVLHTHTHTHKLFYKIQCARTARAIQRNPVSKNQNKRTKKKQKKKQKPKKQKSNVPS